MARPVRALALALLFGISLQALFFRHGPGLNVPLAVALFLTACWILRPAGRRIDPRALWIPAGAVLFAAFCAVRAEAALLLFDVLAALALSIASVVVAGGARLMDLAPAALLAEALRAVGSLAVRGAGVIGAAWPSVARIAGARATRAGGYAAGLLLALPFLAIFTTLFGSADAVFARSVSDLFDARRWLATLGDLPGRLALGALGTWLAAGAFARLHSPPRPTDAGPSRAWLGTDPAIVALAAIDLLFAGFVVLQVTYLFGGRDTIEAAAISHSAYARRGFFELIAVASLVSAVLFAAELSVRARSRPYVAAALTLVALTGVVLASAAYRLDLYQRAYGWTDQRFYAVAMLVFLAAALAILAFALVRARVRWALQPIAIAALTVAAGVNAIGPADHVVRANVARVLVDPSALPPDAERHLDAAALLRLGHGALPALIELLPTLPEPERGGLGTELRRFVARRTFTAEPWQSWNLDRERARRAVEDARERSTREPAR